MTESLDSKDFERNFSVLLEVDIIWPIQLFCSNYPFQISIVNMEKVVALLIFLAVFFGVHGKNQTENIEGERFNWECQWHYAIFLDYILNWK